MVQVVTESFVAEIDQAIKLATLPECCVEEGKPVAHRDYFFGRVRRFRIHCPKGHVTFLRVWSPRGKKWKFE